MVSYTPQQKQAIFDLDRSLVVTAGAGSGKTRVLVGRYVNILQEQAADIDEVIAITFTEKAASEMKGRAWEAIIKKAKESKSQQEALWWRELARRLQSARISTIDSFCAQLVREYPVEAGVDPEFGIMDELDTHRALRAAARSTVDKMLQRKDPYLTDLVVEKGFGSVAQGLLQVYEKMRMTGRSWKEHLSISMASLDRSRALAEQTLDELKRLLWISVDNLELGPLWTENAQLAVSWLADEIDAASVALKLKKRSDEQKDIDRLKSVLYSCAMDVHAQDGVNSVIGACALMDEEYRAARGRGALMDFTGVELAARDLLRDTPAGEAVRSRFRFVLVDEYQDTNRLQDEIISLITGEPHGNRRFVVGDPKQSIYRFRGAVVEVFEEAVRAANGDAGGFHRVELGTNFRSVGPLVGVTNALFTGIWGPERFLPANSHRKPANPESPRAELMLAHLAGKEGSPRGELEAEIVARRIADIVGNAERLVCEALTGADEPGVRGRPVRYGDIAVLLRVMTRVKEFEAALARNGIPYYVVAGTGFYGRPEVMWLTDLLRAVDDRSDVTSLAAALRSPIFGLSDESLLRLKTAAGLDLAVWGGGGDGAEPGAVGTPDPAGTLEGVELSKFRRARHCMAQLGAMVGRVTVGDLMKAAIELAGFEEYFAFVEEGAQSIGNLRKLVQMAEDEMSSRSCLRDFIVDMDAAIDLSAREAEAAMEEESADTVKIMTVHKSKGLEFPVVFLPELAREPRRTGGGLFEYSLPLGLAVPVRMGDEWRNDARHSQAVLDEIRAGDDDEGERCLYVAATRASDYLVMSATLPGPGARARSGGGLSWYERLLSAFPELGERGACGPDGVDEANTAVLDETTGAAILVRHYEESAVRQIMQLRGEALVGAEDGEGEWEGGTADISEFAPLVRPVLPATCDAAAAADETAAASADAEAAGAAAIQQATVAVGAPCQLSVSALMCFSHCPRWYLYEYVCRLGRVLRGPARAFESQPQLNAAVRGQIVHSVCERCDRATNLAQAGAMIMEELHSRGVYGSLADSVADELMPMIHTYLLHYPGLAREGDKEMGFLMDLGGPVVSGVMDRVDVQADGSVMVVDLKTNRVRGRAVDEAAARYRVQLDAYSVAAGRVYGTDRVTARLHFLYPDEVRDVSYGPGGLREAAENLRELAALAARHDLHNTPIQRIAECDRCYFAPLCGFSRDIHGASFEDEEYLDFAGADDVDGG